MSTLARFFPVAQLENPSQPPCFPSASLTIEAKRAYSSTPAFPIALRSLRRGGSVGNSSEEARMSRRAAKVVSSLRAWK